jgi:hypothetical protein
LCLYFAAIFLRTAYIFAESSTFYVALWTLSFAVKCCRAILSFYIIFIMLRGIFTLFLLAFFGYWSILNSLISISLMDLLPLWLVKCLIVFSFFIFSDLVDLDVYKGLFPNRCSTFGSSVTFKLSVINLNVCLKNDIWSTLFAPNLFCLSDDCDLKWHLQQRFISRGSLSFILFYYFILWEE